MPLGTLVVFHWASQPKIVGVAVAITWSLRVPPLNSKTTLVTPGASPASHRGRAHRRGGAVGGHEDPGEVLGRRRHVDLEGPGGDVAVGVEDLTGHGGREEREGRPRRRRAGPRRGPGRGVDHVPPRRLAGRRRSGWRAQAVPVKLAPVRVAPVRLALIQKTPGMIKVWRSRSSEVLRPKGWPLRGP